MYLGKARDDTPLFFLFLAGDAPAGPPVVVPIVKELSQMYTNIESSWGFEKVRALGFRLVYTLGLGLKMRRVCAVTDVRKRREFVVLKNTHRHTHTHTHTLTLTHTHTHTHTHTLTKP